MTTLKKAERGGWGEGKKKKKRKQKEQSTTEPLFEGKWVGVLRG